MMFNIPQIIVLNIEELFNLPVVPLLKKYLILKNTWLYISKLRFNQSNPHTFTTGKVNITFSLIYILICHFPFFPSMACHNKATQLIFFFPNLSQHVTSSGKCLLPSYFVIFLLSPHAQNPEHSTNAICATCGFICLQAVVFRYSNFSYSFFQMRL